MKKQLLKIFIGAGFLLTSLALVSCEGAASPPDAEQPGWKKSAAEPVTLSWYINFSWFTSAWGEDLVAQTMTEETGVTVDFISPVGNEREKLEAMMSTESLPDLITVGHWEPQAAQMIENDLVWPLNELADQYDPYFWQVADPDRVAWYTRPDGNIYAYPNASFSPSDYEEHKNIGSNQTFLVRKDIYEAIGSPDMSTPEGFISAVRLAAKQFPSVDGEPLIPIGFYEFNKDGCFSLEEILMNFLAIPYERAGEKYDRYTDPDYVTWLKTFRRLCQEGYLSQEIFVDRRAQMSEKVAKGRYFCMIYQHTDIADQQKLLYTQNPEKIYIATGGPRNAKQDPPRLPGVGIDGWTVTLISKNCPHPERAIRMMSYMMSEHGQKILYLGVEGITYDTRGENSVIRPEVLALLNSDRVSYNRDFAADNTYWMLQDSVMQLGWQQPMTEPLAQPREWTYPYTIYASQYEANFAENAEMSEIDRKIKEAWGTALPQILLAKDDADFDALFQKFLIEREALGFPQLQQEATRQMKEAKARIAALPGEQRKGE